MVTDENQQEPSVVDVDADSSNSLNDTAEFIQEEEEKMEEELMEDSTSTTGECNSDDCPAEL
jgi:hypothetical protein